MMTSLASAAKSVHGELIGSDRVFDGVSTDTRTLKRGELFVALQGPNFNGRDYVATAVDKGAAGALVDAKTDDELTQIAVPDTRKALGLLGAAWRRDQSAVVVGITGSNGKTTLKALTAACLAEAGPTLATEGNFNNEIGMPLMLTRIEESHRYAVLEMGANHAGEIAYLTSLAEPDVVAITNAAAAHLEGFGSIKGVANAKAEILSGHSRPGVAVLNADDEYYVYWRSLVTDIDVISFGLEQGADVSARNIVADAAGCCFEMALPGGVVDIRLGLPGQHNVRNACAAAAIVLALGLAPEQIQSGLEKVRPVSGRLEPRTGLNSASLYDDSYNANPLSVSVAAEFLASLDGSNWLVLGDMAELGEDEVRLHREVGQAARQAGVDRLYAIGDLSRHVVEAFGDDAEWYADVDALIDALSGAIGADTNVLVKGSRCMHMERVVQALTANSDRRG